MVVIIGLAMYIALWADDVAYNNAVDANDVKEYKTFLSRYPDSDYAADIQLRYDECDYHRVKDLNRESEFIDYIKEHPHSIYVDSVKSIIEMFAFYNAQQTTDPLTCRSFINKYKGTEHAAVIQKRLDELERQFYNKNINISIDKLSHFYINEYYRLFPNGKYADKVEARSKVLYDYEAYKAAKSSDSKAAWEHYVHNYPQGKYISHAKSRIRDYEEIDRYKYNSLANGSQPYAQYYGYNYAESYRLSRVTVTAPFSYDVVVTARLKSNGKVKGHTYVRANRTAYFCIPEGRYSISFYYGNGWYPKKKIVGKHETVFGGFLSDESVGKDDDVYFPAGRGYTYKLQSTYNGNFSTQSSSKYEMF